MSSRTKANSPPPASSSAVSAAVRQPSRKRLASTNTTIPLSRMPPKVMPRTRSGRSARTERSSAMPMETKKSPSNSPLNGSSVTSSSRRYSVSASSTPAMKAPSAMESPAIADSSPAPMTISRLAAMNSSSLLARAIRAR